MSLQSVNLRPAQSSILSTPYISFGAWVWENLTFSCSGNRSTVLKMVGVVMTLWLCGFAYGVRWSRSQTPTPSQKISQSNIDLSISDLIPTILKESSLPQGIEKEELEIIIKLIVMNYITCIVSDSGKYPTSYMIDQIYFQKFIKTKEINDIYNLELRNHINFLFEYLREKEIIKSYKLGRRGNYQLQLNYKFIQTFLPMLTPQLARLNQDQLIEYVDQNMKGNCKKFFEISTF